MSQTTHNTHVEDLGSEANRRAEVPHAHPRNVVDRMIRGTANALPTLAVLMVLAGVAYWGHASGWKLPRFAELFGPGRATTEAWCPVHNVPETDCIECVPTLLPNQADYGWCKDHGVHQCPLCHPDVAQVAAGSQFDGSLAQSANRALAVRDRPENNVNCTLYRNRVQFASIEAVQKAGIDVELVEQRPIVETITATGEITYDETRVAHLSSRVSGTIWRVDANVGDRVRKGDVLALVDSIDVGKAKAELLDALAQVDFHGKTVERLQPLVERKIVSDSRMLEAETALQQAQIGVRRAEQAMVNLGLPVSLDTLRTLPERERAASLQFIGLSESLLSGLPDTMTSNNLIPLVASLDGLVVYREAVSGEVVDPSQMLFQLADTSVMWLRFHVALEDARHLAQGQAVRFQPEGMRDDVTGNIRWISSDVDKRTRTVEVRVDVANPDGNLRNKAFGVGQIILREEPNAVVVPSEAVQWDSSCYVVFVRDRDYFEKGGPKIFHTRTVRPGVKQDGLTEIIAGLLPGEVVATQGSNVLRSQILKNNLGAGCACGH